MAAERPIRPNVVGWMNGWTDLAGQSARFQSSHEADAAGPLLRAIQLGTKFRNLNRLVSRALDVQLAKQTGWTINPGITNRRPLALASFGMLLSD